MSARTALAVPGVGLTVGDVLMLELPHMREEDREDVAWEFTGYPCFWVMSGEEWHPVHCFRRQLREFRDSPTDSEGTS